MSPTGKAERLRFACLEQSPERLDPNLALKRPLATEGRYRSFAHDRTQRGPEASSSGQLETSVFKLSRGEKPESSSRFGRRSTCCTSGQLHIVNRFLGSGPRGASEPLARVDCEPPERYDR